MGVRAKISLVFLVLLVSAAVAIALSERDPEIGVCKLQCEQLRGAEQDEKLRCKQKCEWYHQEKERREKEKGRSRGEGAGGGGGRDGRRWEANRKGEKGSDRERWSNNPYVFEDRHFTTKLQSEHGSVRVLQKFTDRSELFRGIEHYRVAILEAEPQTFIIPNHWDADAILFVVNGNGTISLVNQESRESFNIKRGDIFRVPAGISAYLINKDDNEKLVLAKILRSISVPGELQTFFGVGGENPESSFFNAFTNEVLAAAFNTESDKLESLFGQSKQEQGIFKKISEEQIRSMSERDEGHRLWPFGERKRPYNIFRKDPSVQNDHGSLHEVDSEAFSDLRDVNVAFSFFNITQGSIAGPFYYTKATTVAVVPNGEGWFQMACPHLSEQASGGPISYQRVSSRLRRGTVAVFPAGHPVVIGASDNQNLEVIFFGLNTDQNQWFPLAGRDNVMNQWEEEALELTFGVPAREVQEVINNQKDRLFFDGPQRGGRAFA